MKKILAIGGSNSKKSINRTLAIYASNKIDNSETVELDLNDLELPLFGIDLENEKGFPEDALRFNELINSVDALVISLAEHNSSYTVAFKNAMDWVSRIDKNIWKNKPMLLMATSPGKRGGASVLQAAKNSFPHLGANIVADFSLPFYYENFSEGALINEELNSELDQKIKSFEQVIHSSSSISI